jgi:hypothetical protein
MRWSELQDGQPGLAALGRRRRLLEPGVVLVATIRGDGTPRLSPVEPLIMDGNLWLPMLWQSRKAADLLREPRILVHSVITGRDGGEGEFKVRTIWLPLPWRPAQSCAAIGGEHLPRHE